MERLRAYVVVGLIVAGLVAGAGCKHSKRITNVSYDPTRELYGEINQKFAAAWKAKTGEELEIVQSHAGSGAQSLAVINGLDADVVTLALAPDIDAIATKDLMDKGWQKRLEQNSCPYTSTIVFLVRNGNPKGIKEWEDLVKDGVEVITPHPKTSGGARWNYLAAWGCIRKKGGSEADAKQFIEKLYQHVPVLDSGARGATNTFAKNKKGDVLLAWENEAFLAQREYKDAGLEIVRPSISILAEPPVAVVDKVVDKRGTREVADAYLRYLYTEEAQEIIAKNFYRPRSEAVLKKFEAQFPKMELLVIDDPMFGGWAKAQATHFGDGGIFEQIYKPKK